MLSPGARILWSGPHENRELEVESCRPAGKRLLLKFAGWEGRDRAAELCGGFLCVARGALERPSPDFLFEDEVAQYACVSPTGEMLGQASAFRRFGPGVFLEMIHAGRPCLVPYASPIVVEVDRSERRIVLDPPEGLFDI